MNSFSAKFGKPARNTIAAFMMFWLSGVLFLFCCGTMPTQAAEVEFCPLRKAGNHCDKTKAENDSPIFSKETSNQKFDCCGFLPAVFDKTRKIEQVEQIAPLAAKIKTASPRFFLIKSDFERFTDYYSPVLNQEKIFVKNCIFRI
jgi:hypothetical protein